jgi:parvulin-like peptidyl-prolyl isomerase
VLAAMLAAGCGSSTNSVPSDAAAVVGGQPVPKWRVDALLNQARITYAQQKQPFPKAGSTKYNTLVQRATAYLVVGAMYVEQAKRIGIVVSDADAQAALDKQKQTTYGGSAARQEAAWKSQGLSPAEAKEEQRLQLAEQRIEQKIVSSAAPSDAELRTYYDTHKSEFSVPPSREIRQILVTSMELAHTVETKLAHGASFAALAKKYSQDPTTAKQGGKVVLAKGRSDPGLEQIAFTIKVGQTSPVIRSSDGGIRIIQALGPVHSGRLTPFSSVKNGLRQQLADKSKQSAVASWQTAAKKAYCGKKITYAKNYAPSAENDPCSRPVPATG